VSGKQDKRARALAFREAKRRGLWKRGEAEVYAKWWRRILKRFFPKYRSAWADRIGRWYKAQVKKWAKQARAYVHDQDAQEFERVRAKLERKRQREQQRKMFDGLVSKQ
jgi:hypothetical protein